MTELIEHYIKVMKQDKSLTKHHLAPDILKEYLSLIHDSEKVEELELRFPELRKAFTDCTRTLIYGGEESLHYPLDLIETRLKPSFDYVRHSLQYYVNSDYPKNLHELCSEVGSERWKTFLETVALCSVPYVMGMSDDDLDGRSLTVSEAHPDLWGETIGIGPRNAEEYLKRLGYRFMDQREYQYFVDVLWAGGNLPIVGLTAEWASMDTHCNASYISPLTSQSIKIAMQARDSATPRLIDFEERLLSGLCFNGKPQFGDDFMKQMEDRTNYPENYVGARACFTFPL